MIHHVKALGLDFNISPGSKQCCGSIQIRIIFPDPFLIVLDPGTCHTLMVMSTTKLAGKKTLTEHACRLGPGGPTDKENQLKIY